MTTTAEVPQHMAALASANRIRMYRAEVKRELAALPRLAGLLAVAELVERTPDGEPDLRTMLLFDAVMACNLMGRQHTRRLFNKLTLSERVTLGGMTDRQRGVFCAHVRGLRGTVMVADLAGSST